MAGRRVEGEPRIPRQAPFKRYGMRTLIVDDDPLARQRLRTLLGEEADLEIVAECDGGEEAVSAIRALDPELVFLDVQMPDMDGFDVVAKIGSDRAPAIVFATAFDEFALRAFDANAIDYLLKPVSRERLKSTLVRLRGRAPGPAAELPLPDLVASLGERGQPRERIAVRSGTRFVIIRTDEITWVEAANNYVRLHTDKQTHLYRASMAEAEAMLDPRKFLRIHRSIIINVDKVKTIEPWGLNEHLIVLADGTELTSSRRYRKQIRAAFGC